jgi:hypothetical protein
VLSIEQNLSLLERIVEEFETYILSTQVFWAIDHSGISDTPLPRLTLGGLQLSLNELTAQKAQMNPHQAMRYDRLFQKLEGYRSKWQATIEKKAIQELRTRINLWKAYLSDLEEKPEWIENYPREVLLRVMIDLLLILIGSNPEIEAEIQMIKKLDLRLHDFIVPGKFILDDSLQPVYPQEKFPYLYMRPRESITR